jgi:hypothetical protein
LTRIQNFDRGNFKGLSPSTTPPSERESLAKVVGLIIQEMNLLSTLKRDCENYLFIYKFVKQGDIGSQAF